MTLSYPVEPVSIPVDYNEETFACINGLLARYPDIVALKSPGSEKEIVVLNNPAFIRQVLQKNNRNYTKGIGIDKIKMLLGNGIMVSEGDYWRKQRRMIQPAFHKQVLQGLEQVIFRLNHRLIEAWRRKASAGEPVNLNEEMSCLSLNIILSALFSSDLAEGIDNNDTPFHVLVTDVVRDLKFAMKFRALHRCILEILDNRAREDRWPPDFLTLISHSQHGETGLPMSRKEVVDEVITLIVAGHETTGSALTWCWHLLSHHPEPYEELLGEVGAPHRLDTFAEVNALGYTRHVVSETLRLYPPGWLVSRKAISEDQFGPYPLPAGSDVLISVYALHRNPDHWPHPHEFRPERFAAPDAGTAEDYLYLPFASGPRKCIGAHMALMEMQIHVALVSRAFRLTPECAGVDVPLEPHINLRPKDPLFVKVHVR